MELEDLDLSKLDSLQYKYILLDIAKRYFNALEADILFLLLRNRRNKDISDILNIREPEVARYKKSILRKAPIYYKYYYQNNIKEVFKFAENFLSIPKEYKDIFRDFISFRSLSTIAETNEQCSSNAHRILLMIKQELEKLAKQHSYFQILVDFYTDSKYVLNYNEKYSLIDNLVK